MTCIVSWLGKDHTYIAGDSCGSDSWTKSIRMDPKVFKKKVAIEHQDYTSKYFEIILGCTQSFRMIDVLRANQLPAIYHNQNFREYVDEKFIPWVRTKLKEAGYLTVSSGKETGTDFLIAFPNRIFHIMDDLQVGEVFSTFDACGGGMYYAKGALEVLEYADTFKYTTPEEKLLKALSVAEKHNPFVQAPFIVERIPASGELLDADNEDPKPLELFWSKIKEEEIEQARD